MTTLKQQTDAQFAKTRQAKPGFAQEIDTLLAKARDFQEGGEAIAVGQPAPAFALPDAHGKTVALSDLLADGPVVLMFYRGSWCPYCNLQLKAMQARVPEIRDLGAQMVAISPQAPDGSLTKTEHDELGFTVLSDQDARVAATYGVAWQVPELILDHMRNDRGLDLAEINNGNGSMLPIPATFVLSRDGVVAWQYANVDYRTRAEPDEVIAALQTLA
ncbi:peroxiredoxin-like family protein [Novipirellula caenicola]|uniref:thioredoxin-dependent peroxiredoxin n=1 Tax=Novipirellula caenicola TaxID=1536901 RepID=A0ABP9VLF6_9BACT